MAKKKNSWIAIGIIAIGIVCMLLAYLVVPNDGDDFAGIRVNKAGQTYGETTVDASGATTEPELTRITNTDKMTAYIYTTDLHNALGDGKGDGTENDFSEQDVLDRKMKAIRLASFKFFGEEVIDDEGARACAQAVTEKDSREIYENAFNEQARAGILKLAQADKLTDEAKEQIEGIDEALASGNADSIKLTYDGFTRIYDETRVNSNITIQAYKHDGESHEGIYVLDYF